MTTETPLTPGDRIYCWQIKQYTVVTAVSGDYVVTPIGRLFKNHVRYEPTIDTIYETAWTIRQERIDEMAEKDKRDQSIWACIDPTVLFILERMGLDAGATAREIENYEGKLGSSLFSETELTTIDNHGYLCIVKQEVDRDRVIAEINAARVNEAISTNVPVVGAVAMEESRARSSRK